MAAPATPTIWAAAAKALVSSRRASALPSGLAPTGSAAAPSNVTSHNRLKGSTARCGLRLTPAAKVSQQNSAAGPFGGLAETSR